MKLSTLFLLTGIVLMFFGAGFVLVAELVLGIFGVAVNPSALLLAHVAGAAIFALGLLAWLVRQSPESATVRAIALAIFSFFAIKTIVTLLGQLTGVFNVLGWAIVALDLFFVAGYAYVLFVQRAPTQPAKT